MDTPQEMLDAINRLGAEESLAIQLAGFHAVIRGLLATHPDADGVRQRCDQLVGQAQATAYFMGNPDRSTVLKTVVEGLFEPPESPDKWQ